MPMSRDKKHSASGAVSRRMAQQNALEEIRRAAAIIRAKYDKLIESAMTEVQKYNLIEKREKALDASAEKIAAKWEARIG
jgi:hypothetical protein